MIYIFIYILKKNSPKNSFKLKQYKLYFKSSFEDNILKISKYLYNVHICKYKNIIFHIPYY